MLNHGIDLAVFSLRLAHTLNWLRPRLRCQEDEFITIRSPLIFYYSLFSGSCLTSFTTINREQPYLVTGFILLIVFRDRLGFIDSAGEEGQIFAIGCSESLM